MHRRFCFAAPMTCAAMALLLAALVALSGLSGCTDREVARIDIDNEGEDIVTYPVDINHDLDILFVIDTSGSMAAEQTSLRDEFRSLIAQITTIEHGLPNLHIGVVSTDLGVGEYASTDLGEQASCSATGDEARLQGAHCLAGSDPFIIDQEDVDGSRIDNHGGDIESAFSCIADLGTGGCGFEQPLEAMRRALDPAITPANAGFLRPHARLAVVFITDEDDCSASSSEIFNPAVGALGGWQTGYRCFEYGVTCDVADPRQTGDHPSCRPRVDSPLMHDISTYVEFLRTLEVDPTRDILVAGIIGADADPVVVDNRFIPGGPFPTVRKSCGPLDSSQKGAFPPVRLGAFLESFAFHTQAPICDEELGDALVELGEFMRPTETVACLPDRLIDEDAEQPGLQPLCEVSARAPIAPGEIDSRGLPACDDASDPASSSELPCYTLVPDPVGCSATEHQLVIEANYPASDPALPGTTVTARCAVEP